MPFYQTIELGPFSFNAIRILVLTGLVRLTARREWPTSGMNGIDRAMIAWAVWLLASSVFHKEPSSTLIFRLGLVYDTCGVYILIRGFCRSLDEVSGVCQATAILLMPLAVEMFSEKLTVYNLFSALGGIGELPMIREGRVRAGGPFGHPVLAGTAGAACLPLMIGIWRLHRKTAAFGIIACLVIILSSASSGPILSAMSGIFALFMWHHHHRIRLVQRLAVAGYIALELYMKDPAYFIIARIDLAGGSTSWYRARLIQSAFEHLPEWWLVGTDYTRHWMPWNWVPWSPDHTDITSHYIQMGILGGLPLLLLFIAVLIKGFSGITQALQQATDCMPDSRFMLWALGSSLFVHAVTFFSVSYFDQSFLFLYSTLATISSAAGGGVKARPTIPMVAQHIVRRSTRHGEPKARSRSPR